MKHQRRGWFGRERLKHPLDDADVALGQRMLDQAIEHLAGVQLLHAFEPRRASARGQAFVDFGVAGRHSPTKPLRIAYTVSSELLASPSFSSTRARYTETVFGDSVSSVAMSDSRLPEAIMTSVCSSRSESF
jgi:hypothetical protein